MTLDNSRALRGARGLKPFGIGAVVLEGGSRPARGAWIETKENPRQIAEGPRRALRGARGLKLCDLGIIGADASSRPARGAWIETTCALVKTSSFPVAPCAGRVD